MKSSEIEGVQRSETVFALVILPAIELLGPEVRAFWKFVTGLLAWRGIRWDSQW